MMQTGSSHRITFLLDARISLESLVLNRLHRLPDIRREEWLRGLLMLGFRTECQTISYQQSKITGAHAASRLQTTFSHWLTQGTMEKPEPTPVEQMPVEHVLSERICSKPFAALSKVIG